MTATAAVVTGDPRYADRDVTGYDASCPGCRLPLEWLVETPPIPRVLYSWLDPNGDGQRITSCPGCGEERPEGDLRGTVS